MIEIVVCVNGFVPRPLLPGILDCLQVSVEVVTEGSDSLQRVRHLRELVEIVVLVLGCVPQRIGALSQTSRVVVEHISCVEQRIGYADQISNIVCKLSG